MPVYSEGAAGVAILFALVSHLIAATPMVERTILVDAVVTEVAAAVTQVAAEECSYNSLHIFLAFVDSP